MLSFLRSLFDNGRPVARPRTANSFRPHLAQLDDRIVPALNITAADGLLSIYGRSGEARGTVEVSMGASESIFLPGFGPIAVYQNGVRQPYAWDGQSISSIQVNGMAGVYNSWGAPDDQTDTVILNSVSVPGVMRVLLGGGHDRLTVKGQSAAGEWDLDGGLGNDEVAFDRANVAGPIRVDRSEAVNLRNSAPGSLVTSLASITVWQHSHTTAETSELNVGGGTTIRGDAVVESEVGYVNVTGRIVGALAVNTPIPPTADWTMNNLSYVTVFAGGVVGGNLSVGRSDFLAGRATVSVEGRVNGNLTVYGSSVGDVVLVNTGATVGGNVTVNTAGGNDYVYLFGAVGANTGTQSANILTGDGNDWVEVGGSARTESFTCQLEGGNDIFILRSGAVFSGMLVSGGAGTDSFYGVRTLPNLWLGTFEVFG